MDTEMVMEYLEDYRRNLARAASLRVEIEQAEASLENMRQTVVADMAAPHAQRLDGMPRGGASSTSVVEKIATMIADGGKPSYLLDLEQDIAAMRIQLRKLEYSARYVDAWLLALNDHERWVIQRHMIDGEVWSNIEAESERQFGDPRSKDTLKRLKKSGLEKIFRIAQ